MDATALYWTLDDGSLWKLPLCGTTAFELAAPPVSQMQTSGLAIGATEAYYLNFCGGNACDSVYEVLK